MWLHHTRIEVQSPCAWRVQRTVGVALQPSKNSVPSTVLCTGMAQRIGLASWYQDRKRGSPPTLVRPVAVCSRARAGVPSQRRALGARAEAHRSVPRRRQPELRVRARQAPPSGCPVRRPAHPLGSLRDAGTGPYPRPSFVGACQRRPAPIDAPGWSRLYPDHACSSTWPASFGPPRCCAATARPLRKRPP